MVRRDFRRAAFAYRLSTIVDPKFVVGWYGRAMAHTDSGNFIAAIAEYSEGLRLEPNDASAHVSRGNLYRWTDDLSRAISDFDEAVRLDPKEPTYREVRGCFLLDQRKFDLAIEDFTEAVRSDPQYAVAHLYRGVACHCLGRYEEAIADYTSAIEVDAKYVFSLAVSGLVAPKQAKSQQMAVPPQRLGLNIRSEPCYATAFFNRGLAHWDRADHRLALEDFRRAAAHDPTYLA
jgi:tetratricopeptide (TPR) repeat protein